MNVRKMTLEELELMSYDDIAYELLKLDDKPTTTADLFKEVCTLLQYGETAYMEKISDFYTLLMTDKRFFLLDDGKWDLSINHSAKLELEDIEEEDEELEELLEESPEEELTEALEEEPNELDGIDDIDADEGVYSDEEEELDDLVIVSEEELEE